MLTQRVVMLTALAASLTLTAGLYAGPVTPYTADANTVVLYHLDESSGATTAVDSSGNGMDLSAGVSPFAGDSGPDGLGTSADFSDENPNKQLVRTLSASELAQFSPTQFTVEAWVRNPDSDKTDHNGIIAYRNGGTDRFQFTINQDAIRLDYIRDDTDAFYSGATSGALTWNEDEWYHVAVSYDANTAATGDSIIKFYRNSVNDTSQIANLVATLTNQPDLTPYSVGGRLRLGGFDGIGRRNFGGLLDEVRYSNGVLESFNLAVPTPAALPAGLALMGLVTLRRRR